MIINLRPELAKQLQQRLTSFSEGFRHNLALIGPRGSGKTFQLQQLLEAQSVGMPVIYCPLYRESCRSFLQRFLATITQAGLQTDTAVIESLISRRLYGEAFNRILDLIPLLSKASGRPCVLVLDEFLFLEEIGLGYAFHELGKRVMTWPSVLFVLTSSSPFRAREILRQRLQLLFGQFELLALGGFDTRAAEKLIAQQWSTLRKADAVAPFLVQWIGGYPSYLTVLLGRLRELAALEQSSDVTESLFIRTVWDMVGRQEGILHQWCAARVDELAHTRHGGRAVEALIQLARGVRTATALGGRIGRAGIAECLQRLVEHDLAQRNGSCWMVADPILRCWLSTVLASQRADAQVSAFGLHRQMEDYLRSLWLRWVGQQRLSFSEQIAALFSRFSDDLICLDAKTGRLPKFNRIDTPVVDAQANAYLVAESQGRRWCAAIQEAAVDEQAIAQFDRFCQKQLPKPSRKIVITKSGMDEHARVLAKTANMWVWQEQELDLLSKLYGQEQAVE